MRGIYILQLGENDSSTQEEGDDERFENSKFSMLFKSDTKPPFIESMELFEKELDIPKKLEFRNYTNPFQREINMASE